MNDNYDFTLSYICSRFNKPNLIYIGIGTASNKTSFSSKRENQQFPVFLENIKIKYPELPVICILIDPNLEYPLTCIQSPINNGNISNSWEINKKNESLEIYENRSKNILIISIKDFIVYYDHDNQSGHYGFTDEYKDITMFIESIIELNAYDNGSTIFNDFSGKNFLNFNKYINNKYLKYQDRFVIGLDHNEYGGCFPNLELPEYQVKAYIDKDMSDIRVFNSVKYSDNPDDFYSELVKNKVEKCDIINIQLKYIYIGQIEFFLKYVMTLYRQYHMIKNGTLDILLRFTEYMNIIKMRYKIFEEKEDDINEMFFWYLNKLQKYVGMNDEQKYELMTLINSESDFYKKGPIIKNYLISYYDSFLN